MKKTVRDFNLKEKIVILRCDLNVPIKKDKIIDDTRIIESIETIDYILDKNAKLIILSHLGKIKTEKDKKSNSLKIVYERLNQLLSNKVTFIPFTRDDSIKEIIDNLDYGKAVLLENTRFEDLDNKKESNCDMELAKYWASLGDIFINDAFGTIHRKHASNFGISSYLESGIGFLIEKEIKQLSKLDNPKRPFSVIMGGSKVSDKIDIINGLIDKVDNLYIGGAMAFTFLKASNINVGKSMVEEEMIDTCKKLLTKYVNKIILPVDFYGSNEFSDKNNKELFYITDIEDDFIGMDIGTQTIDMFKNQLEETKTLFWNGPLGVYEFDKYKNGTQEILKFVSENIETIILGGGDIVASATNLGFINKITFASTGGGATLEYLVNKNLPGLENIKE